LVTEKRLGTSTIHISHATSFQASLTGKTATKLSLT